MEKEGASNLDVLAEGSVLIQNLENAVEQLTTIENSIQRVIKDPKQTKNLMFLEKFDLINALDAIIYEAKFNNELCDVKKIIENVEQGYAELKCSQSECCNKAIAVSKVKSDTPAQLYCDIHAESIDLSSEELHILETELKEAIGALESMERMLLILQEQMEYMRCKDIDLDKIALERVEGQIVDEYKSLTSNLNEMMVKAKQSTIDGSKSQALRYESFSFVKPDSEVCKTSTVQILRLIYEINMKPEIEAKLKMLLKWSEKTNKMDEEAKITQNLSIPNEIYGETFELCKIPTQALKKIKELEEKIQVMAKEFITYQKNSEQNAITISSIKKILQEEIQKQFNKNNKDSNGLKAQLTLRDQQFYRDKIKVQDDFNECFAANSKAYNSLSPFAYKLSDLEAQPIEMKQGYKNRENLIECVGVGQFNEGTNDLHGVGIQVDKWGGIQEGYWKYGRLSGQGRNIWASGRYYIGEFKQGQYHGQGTRYNEDGTINKSGNWENDAFIG